MKCCFCKRDAGKYGNNAMPIMDGCCCNECNKNVVIPIRMLGVFKRAMGKKK